MRLPQEIKIGWKRYKVELREPDKTLLNVKSSNYGEIYFDDEKIHIDATHAQRQQMATILHETIHGIDDQHGIGLEEKQVEILTHGLLSMMIDNPDFILELLTMDA